MCKLSNKIKLAMLRPLDNWRGRETNRDTGGQKETQVDKQRDRRTNRGTQKLNTDR